MNNRVNWGAVLAGTTVGLAACFFLEYLLFNFAVTAAGSFGLATAVPGSYSESALAAIFSAAGLSVGAALTVLAGRFTEARAALLHASTSLALSLLITHFLFRDAFFVGRPGLPLDLSFATAGTFLPNIPPFVVWTIWISVLVSIPATLVTAGLVSRRLAREQEKSVEKVAARAA